MSYNTELLVSFLRELADRIEHGNISSSKITSISQFYLKYQMEDNMERLPLNTSMEDNYPEYLTLGWYVYNHLLPNDTELDS